MPAASSASAAAAAAASSAASASALPVADAESFKESAIAPLEAAVAAAGPSAARAGRALLRLYQLYPARLERERVIAALALALVELPRNDFQLALYLVPAALRGDAAVLALEECEKLLQVGRFAALWAKARDPALAGPLAAIAGFAHGIRSFMLAVLNRMYVRIELAELGNYLDLVRFSSGAARNCRQHLVSLHTHTHAHAHIRRRHAQPAGHARLSPSPSLSLARVLSLPPSQSVSEADAFAQQAGWTVEDGKTAVAPLIPENTPRPKKAFDEGLKYAEVSNLVATLTR